MEKVYMDVPKNKKIQRNWESTDRSPYDFDDPVPVVQDYVTLDHYEANEDDFDMNRYENEFSRMDSEMEEVNEPDMYENGNMDFGNLSPKTMTVEKKTVVEEDNPKRITTTWMKVTKTY